MSFFLARLRPLEKYFFGGEITFGYAGCLDGTQFNSDSCKKKYIDEFAKEVKRNASYFIMSRTLPQQTTILGMLRRQMLVWEGIIKNDWNYSTKEKEDMNNLIGPESYIFIPEDEDMQSFGKIKHISPVHIIRKCNSKLRFFIRTALDHNNTCRYEKYEPFEIKSFKDTSNRKHYLMNGFNTKKGLEDSWMDTASGVLTDTDRVFKEDVRVGIQKMKSEEAFFKKKYYRLEEGLEFGFFTEIEDMPDMYEEDIVYMGSEKSAFKLILEPMDKYRCSYDIIKGIESTGKRDNTPYGEGDEKLDKFVLLSDSYISGDIYRQLEYAVIQNIEFRNMGTVALKNENGHGNYNNRLRKNFIKYNLLKKGTVLYTSKPDMLINEMLRHKNLRAIGYNHFI